MTNQQLGIVLIAGFIGALIGALGGLIGVLIAAWIWGY